MSDPNQRSLADAIQCLSVRWADVAKSAPTDSPVFVLAAGWRSGSTLLQRMLMPEWFVWGEPYGHAGLLQNLADPLRCITEDWPEPHFFLNAENRETVTDRFVANLYPSTAALLDAHRAYLETLFKKSATSNGEAVAAQPGKATSPMPGCVPAYLRTRAGVSRKCGCRRIMLTI